MAKKKSSLLLDTAHTRIGELQAVIRQLEAEKAVWRAWQERAVRAERKITEICANVAVVIRKTLDSE